jgi:proteasome assembly chaperone (PAC2) family protein
VQDDLLTILTTPAMQNARLVLAFDGWMDGGEVSTGTVNWLMRRTSAEPVAKIDPEPFYIYNFPGPMDVSAMFRPHLQVEKGLITSFEMPANMFHCDTRSQLVLFEGKEPNINWSRFAECVFEVAKRLSVKEIYFIGSFAGGVPHTREPRLYTSASSAKMRDRMVEHGLEPSDYEGPGSFSTMLLTQAEDHRISMATIVAEIPAYVEGRNAKSIESVARKLSQVLGLSLTFDDLRDVSDAWETRVTEAIADRKELQEQIHKLEADYDDQVFTQMEEFKTFLEEKGLKID